MHTKQPPLQWAETANADLHGVAPLLADLRQRKATAAPIQVCVWHGTALCHAIAAASMPLDVHEWDVHLMKRFHIQGIV